MTTIHALTSTQPTVDGHSKKIGEEDEELFKILFLHQQELQKPLDFVFQKFEES